MREVKEETNLDIRIEKLIGVYSDPDSQVFNYPNGKVVHFITTCFLAEITGGELKCNSDESLEIKFFGRDNLPEDLLTMHRSEEHTSELHHVAISYAVFCLQKKKTIK